MSKFALCVGINDYPGTASDLSGCVNDANDWGNMLATKGFDVVKLLDADASRKNIREAIVRTCGVAHAGDVVVIQFSGHGSFVPDLDGDEPDGNDECLVPHDVMKAGVITDDDLSDLLVTDRGVRVVLLADSCHSGTVARFVPIQTPPTTKNKTSPTRKVRFLPPSTFLSSRGIRDRRVFASAPGRKSGALLLSGCRDAEYSYDANFLGRPNGAFTFVALKALKTMPATATYRDWYTAIRKLLPSQQYPQTPNLYGTTNMKNWKIFK